MIFHGHTLTSKVPFKEVIETIAQYAFKVTSRLSYYTAYNGKECLDVKSLNLSLHTDVSVSSDFVRRESLLRGAAGGHGQASSIHFGQKAS